MVLHQFIASSPLFALLTLAAVLALVEWGMVIVGKRYKLGPDITGRSSHTKFTPTGGGVVWVIAAILGILIFGELYFQLPWLFMGGILVLAVISYIDDIHPLPPIPRLISQVVIMALTFKQLCYPQAFDIYLIILFCGVGIINAINFLDGICGMLALYGIVVTCSIMYTIYLLENPSISWLLPVLTMVLIAQFVFACFNLYDVIFAGDVGAITLSYIQAVAVILIILNTRDASYTIFFAVCVFDTGLTTLQRLFIGEKILEPHKINIYQKLTSEKGIPQLVVSVIYALLQLLINALYFLIPVSQHWTYFLIVCALLITTYFLVRFSFKRQ